MFHLDGKNFLYLSLLSYLLFQVHGKVSVPTWLDELQSKVVPARRLRDSGGFAVCIFCPTNLVLHGTGVPQVCVNNMGLDLRGKKKKKIRGEI